MSDACEVTGYTRNQLRGLLRDLPAFVSQEASARSGRAFTRGELLVICFITEMESTYGMKRSSIGTVLTQLIASIQSPRPPETSSRLHIVLSSKTVTYLSPGATADDGLLIPVAAIFERIDKYLGGHIDSSQGELPLGPVIVSRKQIA